jgi:predicted kinase
MRLVKSLIAVTLIGLLYGCMKTESNNPIKKAENQFSALLEQAEKAHKIPRTLDEKREIIFNALLLGINTEQTFSQLAKKLEYVSKTIDIVIKAPINSDDKFTIIFTGFGYRKLCSKIIVIESQAPALEHFNIQAFIKPLEDTTSYKEGTDESWGFKNFAIKISEVQIALLDYNIATKKIKIDLYLLDFNSLQHFDSLKPNIDWIVMHILGEIAFRKHISEIHLHQMPFEPIGLLPLIDPPDFIAYLYKINSRQKRRII